MTDSAPRCVYDCRLQVYYFSKKKKQPAINWLPLKNSHIIWDLMHEFVCVDGGDEAKPTTHTIFFVPRIASATHHYQYSVLSKPKGAYSYLHHRLYHRDLARTIRTGKVHARMHFHSYPPFITNPAFRQILPNGDLYPTCYTKHP